MEKNDYYSSNETSAVLKALEALGTAAKDAVPDLKLCLQTMHAKHRGRDSSLVGSILRTLEKIGPDAIAAAPAARLFLDTQYGRQAERALEAMKKKPEAPPTPGTSSDRPN